MPVDRVSSVAMYIQVAETLRSEISQGKYPPGSSIGSHTELAKRFSVSMITIRKAIDVLVEDNIVITKQGKGTFVSTVPLNDGFNKLIALSSVIEKNHKKADIVIKEMKYIPTPAKFSEKVRQGLGGECLYIERLHINDDDVMGFARIYLPAEYGSKFSLEDISQNTIYQLYERKLGVALGNGIQYIKAEKASKKLAAVLNTSENTPLLMIERESYSSDNNLIEFMICYYEYTQYSFKIELKLSSE